MFGSSRIPLRRDWKKRRFRVPRVRQRQRSLPWLGTAGQGGVFGERTLKVTRDIGINSAPAPHTSLICFSGPYDVPEVRYNGDVRNDLHYRQLEF